MAIRFIVDSTADLTAEQAQDWQVEIAPLGVTFGGETFLQGVDITLDTFYKKLRAAKELPTTTQVNPHAFEQLFRPAMEAGDEVLVLCLSSKLSGTYQSACIAAELFPQERIAIIDTTTVTIGMQALLERAVRLRSAGASLAEMTAEIEALRPRTVIYAMIDDLTYLVKGGRLPAVGAKVGGLLNLKPMITIEDGQVKLAGMARGVRKAYDWIAQRVAADGVADGFAVYFGHTDAPRLVPELEKVVAEQADLAGHSVGRCDIGVVIGTHAGPGAVAVAFVKK